MILLEKNGAVAEIAEMGAEMRAYRSADGKERLWSGDPAVWAGVAPVLFPVIGCLKNGVVAIAGKEYAIPKHGFAKLMSFQLATQKEDECAFVLEDTEETRAVYPFAFRLTVRHRMLEKGFSTEYCVENCGDTPMPFLVGGHPGFVCPMNEGEAFTDYQVVFEKEEEGRNLLYAPGALMGGEEIVDMGADHRTVGLDYSIFDQKDTLVFAGLKSRSVKLVHKNTGKGIRFSFPESTVLAIWSKPNANAPYVCIEPWNGIPAMVEETGNFEDKPYHIMLAPGQSFASTHQMEVLD